MSKQVEIAIILFSNEGREINFRDLKSGICHLEQKEHSPYFFWGAQGGFEIIINGYKTIFRGFDFYLSIEAIKFLLHSLYWLEGRENDFDTDKDFPDAVVSRFQNHNYITLTKRDNDKITFSYQSTLPQMESARGNRFFNEELFLSKDWADSVKIGLKEYFDVLIPILQNNPEDEQSKILSNYLVNDWIKIKG